MNDDLRDDAVERLIRIAGPRPAVPADIAARVRANVHEAWRNEVGAGRTRSRFIWTLPLAAAIATAVILTINRTSSEPEQPWVVARIERVTGNAPQLTAGAAVNARSTITTAAARAAFRLADGTSIRIDEQSRVRFDTPHRIALESGALYVDAKHSGIRIETPFGIVRDVGTRFEVRVTADKARIRVRDGEIAVANHHARRGEQLDVMRNGDVATTDVPPFGGDWRWLMDLSPRFQLEGARVAEFLAWVSAESGMEVRYDSQATAHHAAETTMHGSVGDLRADVAADAILPTARMRASIRGGVLTVSR
jgi:ferric-dicitrate binding protein FerR (iron transport regulator)